MGNNSKKVFDGGIAELGLNFKVRAGSDLKDQQEIQRFYLRSQSYLWPEPR